MKTNKLKIIFYFFAAALSPFIGCDCEEEIISTSTPQDTHDAIKLYSSDGGLTWGSHIFSTSLGPGPDVLYSITSTSEGVFLTSGSNYEDNFVVLGRSTDFGDYFSFSTIARGLEVSRNIVLSNSKNSAVLIIDRAMLISSIGAQLVTVNNGYQWAEVSNIGGMNSVTFYDALNGIIVGNLGTIYKTTSGGYNWVGVNSPTATDLRDVSFYETIGLAVGMLGRVIKTTDGGNTWVQLTTPTQNTFNGVVWFSPGGAIAVGSNGAIIRTTDGGQSWQQIEWGGNNFLNDIAWNYDGTLILCGAGGTILRSTDNGLTWIRQTSGTTRTLYGIYFQGDCYIVGD